MERAYQTIKKFWRYLLGKKSELKDINVKDGVLAKVVLDIHRKRTHSEFVMVPLHTLQPVHVIDRENALSATDKRARVLAKAKNELCRKKYITREDLADYLPSVSGIKVVRENENSLIAYEGNGRLAALHRVFSPEDEISVEVEEYHFKNPAKIIRRMNRVRRLNGLI